MLGTNEPIYPDPDPDLLAAAVEVRAAIDPAKLRGLVESLPGPRSRLHAPIAMAQADALITDAWRSVGWQVERQELDLHGVWGIHDEPGKGRLARYARLRGANLIATKVGQGTDAIVVAAHHDTVGNSPGADDNGAGVAILIEAARLLATQPLRRTGSLRARLAVLRRVLKSAPDRDRSPSRDRNASPHLHPVLARHCRVYVACGHLEPLALQPVGTTTT